MTRGINWRGIKRIALVMYVPWAFYWSFSIYTAQSTLNKLDHDNDPFMVILLEDSRNHAAFMLIGFPILLLIAVALAVMVFRWVRKGFEPEQS